MGALTRSVRKVGWGVGDQGLSSLTNFAVGVAVARAVDVEAFGAFSLAFATYIIVLNLARALATEPLVVRYSGEPLDAIRRGSAAAAGTALTLGAVAGAGCIVFALFVEGSLHDAFLALGIMFPGLMVQDAWRLSFFAAHQGGKAFANDLLWAVLLLPGAALLEASGQAGVFIYVLLWGGAATAGAFLGMVQAGAVPRIAGVVPWLREHRDLTPNFLGELMVLSMARQFVLFGVGAIVGLVATGALRAAQILLNPLHVLTQGIRLVAIPDAVRMLKRSDADTGAAKLWRMGGWLATGLVTVTLAIAGAVYVLPLSIGEALMGETWAAARPLVIPVGLSTAGGGAVVGASVGLRALAAARRSRQARQVMSGCQLGFGLLGAVIAGASGAAWGLAAANIGGGFVWWWHLRRGLDEHRRGEGAQPSADAAVLADEPPVVT